MDTFLVSLFTSIIVSLFTFVLGLKSGKNQTDRKMVQDIYKKLYAHFDDLKDFLKRNRPKSWENYKSIKYDLNRTRHIPVVAELKMNGDLLHVTRKIAEESYELECDLMNCGSNESRAMRAIHKVLCTKVDLYVEGWKFENYNNRQSDAHFKLSNPNACKSQICADYRDWFDKDRIVELFSHLTDDCGIEFRYQGNDVFTFTIYPNAFSVSTSEYIERIYQDLCSQIPDFKEICDLKNTYIKRIDKLNKKIAKKVKEPFSFWGTFFGAFADLFK